MAKSTRYSPELLKANKKLHQLRKQHRRRKRERPNPKQGRSAYE